MPGRGEGKGAAVGFHAQKVGVSAFVPHIHCHVFASSGPASDLYSPGPSFSCSDSWARRVFRSMIAFASSRLQAVRMTLIPINSDGLQAAFPADFKLQLQTQRQQPYRDCQISSHNGIRSNPQNELFTDTYIIVYIYTTQIHAYIQTYIPI